MESNLKQRIIIFFVIIAAAVVFLIPTIMPDNFRGKDGAKWISKPISLGLDLSGGVHLVYEVQTSEAVKSKLMAYSQSIRSELRNDKIATSRAIVNEKNQIEITLLSSAKVDAAKEKIRAEIPEVACGEPQSDGDRVKLVCSVSPKHISDIEKESVTRAVETLRNRVDQYGVSEPIIQQQGEKRVLLQMPGVTDIQAVKDLVGRVAKLEFKLVPTGGDVEGSRRLKSRQGSDVRVEDQSLMTGDSVADARVMMPDGRAEVSLTLTAEGAKLFREITEQNTGRQLAIILDNVVYSDPVIREPISGGQASISGRFTLQEASQLAMVLRSGALPAPLDVLEERTVGPTLGKESIRQGLIGIIVGFIAIVIFMAFYYGKSGVLASVSIAINLFLLVALLSAFGATLTLPGLAGLALTAGMAVDSNVIIFERIRDEFKIGASRDAAVNAGFNKALSAIMDSNITTLVSGLVLYMLGSGPIKGFAVTLSIGIITTVYCATFVSRLGFDFFPLRGRKGLSI